MINAANRSGVGNAWHKPTVRRAMDESLARRVKHLGMWSIICNACHNTNCALMEKLKPGYREWIPRCGGSVWIFTARNYVGDERAANRNVWDLIQWMNDELTEIPRSIQRKMDESDNPDKRVALDNIIAKQQRTLPNMRRGEAKATGKGVNTLQNQQQQAGYISPTPRSETHESKPRQEPRKTQQHSDSTPQSPRSETHKDTAPQSKPISKQPGLRPSMLMGILQVREEELTTVVLRKGIGPYEWLHITDPEHPPYRLTMTCKCYDDDETANTEYQKVKIKVLNDQEISEVFSALYSAAICAEVVQPLTPRTQKR